MKIGNGFDYRLKKKQYCPKKQLKNAFNAKKTLIKRFSNLKAFFILILM